MRLARHAERARRSRRRGPPVGGIVIANAAPMSRRDRRVKAGARRARPPAPGVELVTVYDRLELASARRAHAASGARRGGGRRRAGHPRVPASRPQRAVPLVTLPAGLLLTFAAMWLLGVPVTIMSLGGIGDRPGHGGRRRRGGAGGLPPPPRSAPAGRSPAPGERRADPGRGRPFAPAILTSLVIAAARLPAVLAFSRRDRPAAAPAGADQDAGRSRRRRWSP